MVVKQMIKPEPVSIFLPVSYGYRRKNRPVRRHVQCKWALLYIEGG